MDEIFEIADSISILRDGKMIGTDTVENLTQDKVISMMVGRELEIFKRDGKIDVGEVCLEVKHYSNKKINDINFSPAERGNRQVCRPCRRGTD